MESTLEFPFFIEWLSKDHPSQDGTPLAEIEKIVISDADHLADSWFKEEIMDALGLGDVEIEWIDSVAKDEPSGITAIHVKTPTGLVVLD